MFSRKRLTLLLLAGLLSAGIIGFAENYGRIAEIGEYIRKVYAAAAVSKEAVNFNGPIKATTKGKTALGIAIRQLSEDTQMIVFLGKLTVKGKITPDTAGAALPRKLNLIQRHKDAGNKIVSTN